MQTISEVMTADVHAVSPRDTVRRAAQMMDALNVGALPVCDGEKLVGMVTDRDIAVRAVSAGIAPDDAMVDDVMSTDVRCCFADQPLTEAMQQMAAAQVRRIPVVSHDDAHTLVGIVSVGDIATRTDGDLPRQAMRDMLEKLSYPSAPDRATQGRSAAASGHALRVRASGTGTAGGLAGSDVLAQRMNPDIELSSTDDPSDMVEVTPENLVNRNAPGSTSLKEKRATHGGPESIQFVRRTANGQAGDTARAADNSAAAGEAQQASAGASNASGSDGANASIEAGARPSP